MATITKVKCDVCGSEVEVRECKWQLNWRQRTHSDEIIYSAVWLSPVLPTQWDICSDDCLLAFILKRKKEQGGDGQP